MYSTCLFCNGPLGHNEAIEAFPVGRRLAFDADTGRLWVVCRGCARWNLTPLEERWEAIEACERAFRETRLRVSTDQIGLARLREGLELVRIGAPQRPEMAAWRYGDQFGRRRRRAMLIGGGTAIAIGGYLIAGPVLGVVATVGLGGTGIFNFANFARTVYRARTVAARIPVEGAEPLVVQLDQVPRARLTWSDTDERWALELQHRTRSGARAPWWHFDNARSDTVVQGDAALRAAALLLPSVNASGASDRVVRDAVDYLSWAESPAALFAHAAREHARRAKFAAPVSTAELSRLPPPLRLALEMTAHEDAERRALRGELHLLESTWREAEEIAGIADDLLLPPSVDADLARLKRRAADER